MSEKKLLRLNVVARILEVSTGTLRFWAKQGRLEFVVTNPNQEKRIPHSELLRLRQEKGHYVALYACVPYSRRTELAAHVAELEDWARKERPGLKVKVFAEVGLSFQGQRRKFKYLLEQVAEKKVMEVICLFPDCFFLGDITCLTPMFDTVGCQITYLHPNSFFFTPPDVARAICSSFASFISPKINEKKLKSEIQMVLLKGVEEGGLPNKAD